MRQLALTILAAGVLAPAALAAAPFPGMPTPMTISYNLTPVVNAVLARNHWTRWRFAKAVCQYTSNRGQYLCTAAHVYDGIIVDPYSDVWEVDVKGSRWSYRPSSVCPLVSQQCAHTDTSPLNQPNQ